MLTAVLAGLVTGFLLGLTGAGGSVLTLPALIAIVGLSPQPAVGASLVSVGLTAATGLLRHLRAGHIVWRAAAGMAAGGAAAAALGGYLGRLIPGAWLMSVFGLLMLLVAWRMGTTAPQPKEDAPPAGFGRLLVMGAGVGLLSGLLGIGGGFLIVPVLAGPGGLSMQAAIGTALAVITVNAAMGLGGAMAQLGALPWLSVLPFVAASLLGGQIGAHFASRWNAGRLARIFAALVLIVGLSVLAVYLPRVLFP